MNGGTALQRFTKSEVQHEVRCWPAAAKQPQPSLDLSVAYSALVLHVDGTFQDPGLAGATNTLTAR